MKKRVLVIGATGAMGSYLAPKLAKMGYEVDGLTLLDVVSDTPGLKYIKCNAKDLSFLEELMKNEYAAIVDFLIYPSCEIFEPYKKLFLSSCDHYIFFSSYRVYANTQPITETSPRLLDVAKDPIYLASGDYSLYKAKEEDLLNSGSSSNYTIIRPAITYSKIRFQLTTMECNMFIPRMFEGKAVVLPEPAMDRYTTMSWAGDVAEMIARLILNPDAKRETYTAATAEYHTWREVADIYGRLGGLKYVTASTEDYLGIIDPDSLTGLQQLTYDRYFDRIVDNRKILTATGMKQSELLSLEEGLGRELSALTPTTIRPNLEISLRMDDYLKKTFANKLLNGKS